MSEHIRASITFLLEHEIIAAAKTVRRFHEVHEKKEEATEAERMQAMADLVNTCSAALWHATGERPLILTSARTLFGGQPVRVAPADVADVAFELSEETQP